MSELDELIEEFCPEGIPKLQLNELVTFEKGAHLSDDDFQPGVFPVVTASRSESRRHAFSNVGPKAVTVTSHGAYAGHVNFWEDAIWLAGNVFLLRPNLQMVSEKFLFYVLKNSEETIQGRARGGGIPYMNSSDLKGLMLPAPPLEVQREIVSILDKFTQLEAELEAELEARRVQYEVTRDRLLDFSGALEEHPLKIFVAGSSSSRFSIQPLGDLVRIRNGRDYKHLEAGEFPVFGSGGVMTHVAQSFYDKPSVLIPRKGSLGNLFYVDTPFWTVDTIFYTEIGQQLLPKYLFYYLKTVDLAGMNLAGGVPSLTQSTLNKLQIPVPSLDLQQEIVSILDKLDTLVNDITIGLPAEIAARRKQYEFYRNKLLTFKEVEAA